MCCTLEVVMKKLISAVVIAGALSQITNAMGPMGDITHRHFYKEQDWIWQDSQAVEKAGRDKAATTMPAPVQIWAMSIATTVPLRPPPASTVLLRLPVASTVPLHLASLATTVPLRPPPGA